MKLVSVVAILFLANGIAVAQASAQTTVAMPNISGTRLEITARGQVRRVPDMAVIGAGIVTQAADAATAMRDNAAKMASVTAAIRRAGIAQRDVMTSAISLSPQYRYAENQPPVITGYQASNQVSITFRDIAKSGAILDMLVAQGVNQINGPTLSVENEEAALDEARADAVKIANSRALLYAKAAGLRVKRIVSMSEVTATDGNPMPVYQARAVTAQAKTEISPGEQTIGVSLLVIFELE